MSSNFSVSAVVKYILQKKNVMLYSYIRQYTATASSSASVYAELRCGFLFVIQPQFEQWPSLDDQIHRHETRKGRQPSPRTRSRPRLESVNNCSKTGFIKYFVYTEYCVGFVLPLSNQQSDVCLLTKYAIPSLLVEERVYHSLEYSRKSQRLGFALSCVIFTLGAQQGHEISSKLENFKRRLSLRLNNATRQRDTSASSIPYHLDIEMREGIIKITHWQHYYAQQ